MQIAADLLKLARFLGLFFLLSFPDSWLEGPEFKKLALYSHHLLGM
jgi:hypothetical protein